MKQFLLHAFVISLMLSPKLKASNPEPMDISPRTTGDFSFLNDLEALPSEALLLITDHLDLKSVLSMRHTSRLLFARIGEEKFLSAVIKRNGVPHSMGADLLSSIKAHFINKEIEDLERKITNLPNEDSTVIYRLHLIGQKEVWEQKRPKQHNTYPIPQFF